MGRSEGGEWEVSVCKVDQTEEGRGVFGGGDTLVSGNVTFFPPPLIARP